MQGFTSNVPNPLPISRGGTGTAGSAMLDANGNEVVVYVGTSSAVNHIQILNNATGSTPAISAIGGDTNITLQLNGKGTGGASIVGVSTNSNAAAGEVGEFISSVIPNASAVSLTTATDTNVTSISLTAGDWDVVGNVFFSFSGGNGTNSIAWCSVTSATVPDASLYNSLSASVVTNGIQTPFLRVSIAATTTVYLSGRAAFPGTGTASGAIYARRVR